jgi:valine dehydrogenase (NAD+)
VTNVFAMRQPDNPGPGQPDPPPDPEQVVFCQDTQTGLRAIISIYSTALGPGLGGTRFYPYRSEDEALADALRL